MSCAPLVLKAVLYYDRILWQGDAMRYDMEHKALTRTRMVETASRVLRREGIAAAGVATLMAEAGLTNGAFYAHFKSKEALVAAAVVFALEETNAAIGAAIRAATAMPALDAVIDHYLDPRHVAHPEYGCAVAALGPELARRPAATRRAVDDAIERLVATIATALPAQCTERQDTARAVFACLAGTIQLARGSNAAPAAILARGAAAVRAIAGANPHQETKA
jgi:TetR/AcrR family transcriptional regulator, transcriptional repressor for nem operon